jgi:hypothetical protein
MTGPLSCKFSPVSPKAWQCVAIALTGLVIAVCWWVPAASGRGRKSLFEKELVLCPGGRVSVGDACFNIGPTLFPREFFLAVERIVTPTGPKFRKGSSDVRYYPEETEVYLLAGDSTCSEDRVPSDDGMVSHYHPREARSLRFRLVWLRNGVTRPVELIPPVNAEPRWKPSPLDPQSGDGSWAWNFHVRSGEVPLSDELVLYVDEAGGKSLACLPCAFQSVAALTGSGR